MKFHNYHTHSIYCDGTDMPEEYVKAAIDKGMAAIGFSGHAPVPFENKWSMKHEKMEEYSNVLDDLKIKYSSQINVYKALEIDYIRGITKSFDSLKRRYSLDYTIGSVHLVYEQNSRELWFIDGPEDNYIRGLQNIFNNDVKKAVILYYKQIQEMVITQKPDMIAHIDKIKMNNKDRFFKEDEKWYRDVVDETLKVIAGKHSIVEVNTRGIYKKKSEALFPSVWILEKCRELNIPVILNSDAHSPSDLTEYFPETITILKDIGFHGIHIFNNHRWELAGW